MKLIITGATGLTGTEIVRQSLALDEITSVIALARKPLQIDDCPGFMKLKNVQIQDYGEYTENIKAELAQADACIWTVAVTPFRMNKFEFSEVKRVCQDCTMAGIQAMYESRPARPFRFIYLSAKGTPQDLTKKPFIMGDYQIMRGETEQMLRQFASKYDDVELYIAQPGVITNDTTVSRAILAAIFNTANTFTRAFANVRLHELAAALLQHAIHGNDKEISSNEDLVRVGQAALKIDVA